MANFMYAESYLGGQNKTKFIETTKQQIKVFNLLLNRLELLKNTLSNFDNKVLNIRFKNAFKSIVEPLENKTYCSLSALFYDYNYKQNKAKFGISFHGEDRCVYIDKHFAGYLPEYSWEFEILVNLDKRILAIETIRLIDEKIIYFKEKIIKLQDCIDRYDEYMQKSIEIERLIVEYKESIPYPVKLNISVGRPYNF